MHYARVQIVLEAHCLWADTPYLAECGVSSSLSGIGYTTTFLRICESGSTLLLNMTTFNCHRSRANTIGYGL